MTASTIPPQPLDPLSEADIAALRRHPGFRAAVEAYAAANLARHRALGLVERWMIGDMGRASLTGTALVLETLGRLTPAALLASPPVARGEVSRGRARLYLQRAAANGLIAPSDPAAPLKGDTPLSTTPRFQAVTTGLMQVTLEAVAPLAPEAATALAQMGRPAFAQRFAGQLGTTIAAHPRLFPLTSSAQLFQARDGGTRILEELILRQAPGRDRLLERCAYSHSALARVSQCSRAHVIQLLQDGEARGVLTLQGRVLTATSRLSDEVERYFAGLFATARRAAAAMALAEA